MKKLYKSKTNRIVAGVLGGIGEYFDIDPTLLRLAYVLVAVITAVVPAIVAYIIAVFIVPEHPDTEKTKK